MIQAFADWFTFVLLELNKDTSLALALNFFLYDSIKIIVLLFLISIIMGIVNSYIQIEQIKNYLTEHKLYGFQYFMASFLGALTPFCSCSSIPLFIGFIKGGIPLGVTFAFLITSPLVNEVAVAMFLGTFGVRITLIYVISGIILGMFCGLILGRMHLEPYLSDWVNKIQKDSKLEFDEYKRYKIPFNKRLPSIISGAYHIVRGVIIYIIIGIAIGSVLHGYVPEGFFSEFMAKDNIMAVPISVLLAVPMYSNAAGIVPVLEVLVAKGVPIGTAIAFMMAVVGLSLPEATLLKKVMTWKLIGIFFGVVTICIIISGYFYNIIL